MFGSISLPSSLPPLLFFTYLYWLLIHKSSVPTSLTITASVNFELSRLGIVDLQSGEDTSSNSSSKFEVFFCLLHVLLSAMDF
jgi:hypothetical protein